MQKKRYIALTTCRLIKALPIEMRGVSQPTFTKVYYNLFDCLKGHVRPVNSVLCQLNTFSPLNCCIFSTVRRLSSFIICQLMKLAPMSVKHHMSSLTVARDPLDSRHLLSAMRQQSTQFRLSSSMLSMTSSLTFNLLASVFHERPTFSATKERKLSSGEVLTNV